MLVMIALAIVGFCVLAALLLWGRPLLHRYAQEPVGGGIPALTCLLILVTPQMADMMAAISGGRALGGGYDEAAWHQLGFGLATGFLGFQGWFWMRAALNARAGDRDTRWGGERPWAERWAPRLVVLPALIIALSPLIVAVQGRITPASIPWFGVGAAILSSSFLLWFTWRRRRDQPFAAPAWRPLPRWRCVRLIAAAPLHRGWAVALLALGILGFALPQALPDQTNDALHTAAAALLGMACLIPVTAIVLAALRDVFDVVLGLFQQRRPYLAASDILGVVALVLLPVLGGWVSEEAGLYDVAAAHDAAVVSAPKRPTVTEAADGFVACGDPVIAVISGGASRSAAWGLSMMAALDAVTGERFSRHLFAISSVSGGSLAAVTYAMVRRDADQAGRPVWDGARAGMVELARADLLSSAVFRMLTTDVLTGIPSRGWALGRAFEHFWAWHEGFAIPGIQRGEPSFLKTRSKQPCAPHLLLNGTDSGTGSRVITSTLAIQASPGVFADSVDAIGLMAADMSAADAVLSSARFPIISPPGFLKAQGDADRDPSVVDGGVFEAIGARTARELAEALVSGGKHPIIIAIRNDGDEAADAPGPCEPSAQAPKTAAQDEVKMATAARQQRGVYVPEFLTSLLGLNAARGAHGRAEMAALRTAFCPGDNFYDFDMPAVNGDIGNPGVPMNWVLDGENCALLLGTARLAPRNVAQAAALARRLGEAVGDGELGNTQAVARINARKDDELCRRAIGQEDR